MLENILKLYSFQNFWKYDKILFRTKLPVANYKLQITKHEEVKFTYKIAADGEKIIIRFILY